MKRSVYLFLLGSALIAALLIRTERSRRVESPEALTRTEMPAIADAIQLYWLSKSSWPPALLGSNDVTLYESLTSTNTEKRLLPEHVRWDEPKKLIDRWGNEYRFKTSITTNADGTELCELKIWSCGPTGKDQSGSGDNIKLVRKWRKKL